VHQQLEAEEYGDVGSQIGAGLEGVAQGATLGGYGAVAGAISDDYDAERRLRQQYNPSTALAGEVVGAVAPALLSGGTGALGTAARFTLRRPSRPTSARSSRRRWVPRLRGGDSGKRDSSAHA
jgi:hypothetical protein